MGTWFSLPFSKGPLLAWKRVPTVWHPILWTRINRVLACDSFSELELIALDSYKNNHAYYFIRVTGFTAWVPDVPAIGARAGWDVTFNIPPVCYFLGKFPVYWVLEYNHFGYAHDAIMGQRWAMGMTPSIPAKYNPEGESIFKIDRDRWEKYVSPQVIQAYLTQPQALAARADWLTLCKSRSYLPDKPTKTISTTPTPATTGATLEELTLPTPDALPSPELGSILGPPYMRLILSPGPDPSMLEMTLIRGGP